MNQKDFVCKRILSKHVAFTLQISGLELAVCLAVVISVVTAEGYRSNYEPMPYGKYDVSLISLIFVLSHSTD